MSHWRGFGHVSATLKGIADALEHRPDFDYVVLLTGQDYPLRSPRRLERVLGRAEGRSFPGGGPSHGAAGSRAEGCTGSKTGTS